MHLVGKPNQSTAGRPDHRWNADLGPSYLLGLFPTAGLYASHLYSHLVKSTHLRDWAAPSG